MWIFKVGVYISQINESWLASTAGLPLGYCCWASFIVGLLVSAHYLVFRSVLLVLHSVQPYIGLKFEFGISYSWHLKGSS